MGWYLRGSLALCAALLASIACAGSMPPSGNSDLAGPGPYWNASSDRGPSSSCCGQPAGQTRYVPVPVRSAEDYYTYEGGYSSAHQGSGAAYPVPPPYGRPSFVGPNLYPEPTPDYRSAGPCCHETRIVEVPVYRSAPAYRPAQARRGPTVTRKTYSRRHVHHYASPAPVRYVERYAQPAPVQVIDIYIDDRDRDPPQGCDRRGDYGPGPRREFHVRSYGGAEQHYGTPRCHYSQRSSCGCDDGQPGTSGEVILGQGFNYSDGGVGPIPDSGYVGGGGGGGGGMILNQSSNAYASASAYASSSSHVTVHYGGGGHGGGGHGGGGCNTCGGGHGGGH